MNVRLQISMVFHLDKCIGCHTCSVACKNIWTDRKGAEYMWWNNVETKPGTGYPTRWEDQERYRGGWELRETAGGGEALRVKAQNKGGAFGNIFFNPHLPMIDDYYEPFTYRYDDLINAPEGADQPTARPISMITGRPMDIERGPNWDDDLGGSPNYAENDPNLEEIDPAEREMMFRLERMVYFYIPRICNHCLNACCVAGCPSGAIYKRGEDGIVLINQEICRGWRYCITACPYKKVFYNWATGKSEKCILCFPRLETGQAPACFHSCVGRIRYMGGLFYDADRIQAAASVPDEQLVDAQRDIILDPFNPEVIAGALRNGIEATTIKIVQRSPVYRWVKEWKLALPLHAEYRTVPMLFYVPPLLPVMADVNGGTYDTAGEDLFAPLERARVPVRYLAKLLAAGNEGKVRYALQKLMAVRSYQRMKTVGDVDAAKVQAMLAEVGADAEEVEAIYHLTALAPERDRFVIPPLHREEAEEMVMTDLEEDKGETGFGFVEEPMRGL
jgi:nitrate reductase beta subunit